MVSILIKAEHWLLNGLQYQSARCGLLRCDMMKDWPECSAAAFGCPMCFAWCLCRWVALPMSAESIKHLPPILCIGNRPAFTHRPNVLLDIPKCLQTTLAGISRLPIADCITACFSASVIVARWSNAALIAMAAMSSMSICCSSLLNSSKIYDKSISIIFVLKGTKYFPSGQRIDKLFLPLDCMSD